MRLLHVILLFCLSRSIVHAEDLRYLNKDLLIEIKESPKFESLRKVILEKGNKALSENIIVVTNKSWSFSGDLHFYNTMAPYWWPEEKNGQVVYVNKDGQVNPQCEDLDRLKIQKLSEKLRYLCIAYYLSSDKRYYKAFVKQLDAWFVNKKTRMYPNFEYAQVVPGKNSNKGRAVGIIEGHAFNQILDYIRLMESCRSIGKTRYNKIVQWFTELGQWMEDSKLGQQDSQANSNQSISFDIILLNISLFTGNELRVERIIKEFPLKRIYKQIDSYGRQSAELARTNGYQYSLGNLDYFLQFCLIAESAGYHVYSENKERINMAFGYLYSFVGNTKAFPYQQLAGFDNLERKICRLIKRARRLNPSIEKEIGANIEIVSNYTKGWTDL